MTSNGADIRLALVTGAASGIGAAFASRLAERKFGLLLVDKQQDALMAVARDIEARHGVSAKPIRADLENTAWLSSCLLLLITAGAVIGSLRFEKRFWCRYLCPVGGMNGLFAKLSILELRAQVGTCSGSCSTYGCFKGGPAHGEGLATAGCPLGTHPAHLSNNRNCVLCMSCAQACPHRSVQLSLRPPAAAGRACRSSLPAPTASPALHSIQILTLAGLSAERGAIFFDPAGQEPVARRSTGQALNND